MPLPLSRALPALALLCALAHPASGQERTELPLDTWVTGVLTSGEEPEYRLPADYTGWIEIVLESGDFDTYVTWVARRVGEEMMVESNDDADGLTHRTDSRLRVPVRPSGDGFVVVGSYGGSGSGEYRLRATAIEGPAPTPRIEYGDVVTGTLTERNDQGQFENLYEFDGAQGDLVWITLESDDFDAYLVLILDGQEIGWDDDSYGGYNSGLQMGLPRDGTYQVSARSYSSGSGDYRLQLGVGEETVPERLRGMSGMGGFEPEYTDTGWDESVPSTWDPSRQELVRALEMPPEMVMTPHELDWPVDDGSRLVNERLGFDFPSSNWNMERVGGRDLVELREDMSRDFFGVRTPPTNFGAWAWGDMDDGAMMIVLALKTETAPDAEALTNFGGLIRTLGDARLTWMDIQWEESRSAVYRFEVDRDMQLPMRCTAGGDRRPGGLMICAFGLFGFTPERMAETEAVLAGLRVR